MPNGAKPFGSFGSLNGSASGLNEASNESTRPLWKSAAYSRSLSVARPSYSAPCDELSTAATAAVPLTVGDQPRIWPACVSKRNRDDALTPFWLITNAAVFEFATVPVGPPGTVTVSAFFEPRPV